VLIGAILLGLLVGLLVGGSIWNLANVRLRWIGVLLLAVVVRFGTEAAIGNGIELAEQLRLPLFGGAYALLLVGLWANRAHPGMSLAFVGIFCNLVAITLNDGRMPIWEPSLIAAGLSPEDARTVFHTLLPAALDADFLRRAGPLADVIPIPVPVVRNVASVGDLFLASGLAFFLFATVVRSPSEADEEERALAERRAELLAGPSGVRRHRMTGGSSLAPGLAEWATLERPLVGGRAAGPAGPGIAPPEAEALPESIWETAETVVIPAPSALERPAVIVTPAVVQPAVAAPAPAVAVEPARRHPYVRLALNSSFSALWAGQAISLLGDRVHYIALGVLVLATTNSIFAVGAVFFAASLPNLLFSPLAGTLVDRWDQREVMVVSDLLRAAIVLLIPLAAITNIVLVYPLAFLVTTISIFFRPARVAVLPRIVRDDELLTANSALWIAETMADIVGFTLAGLFVSFLGPNIALAFWIDAATYAASAALIWTIVVPPVQRSAEAAAGREGFTAELREGWRFLRGDRILLANTLQATVAQFTLGVVIALTLVYARDTIFDPTWDAEARFGFLEAGIGVGSLVGGIVVGLIGGRFPKGRLIILGYAACGAFIALLGVTSQLPIAIGLMAGAGLANMIFVIPSQTLFQQRTPAELLGRVASFRFALVFGAMTIAMAVGGILAEKLGVAPVLGIFGLLTLAAGLAGMLVPAVRDA
jgi:MFS family permease